jgi:hypothetical protein
MTIRDRGCQPADRMQVTARGMANRRAVEEDLTSLSYCWSGG